MKPVGLLGAALCFATAAWADLGFPDYVKFPPQIVLNPEQSLQNETVAEAEFQVDASGTPKRLKGHRFARWMVYKPAAGEPAPGYYNGTEARIFQAMQVVLTKGGWQMVTVNDNKSQWVMRFQGNGKQAWAEVKMDAPQAQVWLELIELSDAGAGFAIAKPAATPEKYTLKDDIPFLPPWPGSTRLQEGHSTDPLDVAEPGKGQEPQLVGQTYDARTYQAARTVSKLQFIGEYREALLKAGWTVLYPASAAAVRDYGTLAAHYTQNGRDIWTRIAMDPEARITFNLVDSSGTDLAASLNKDCHVPLYGVLFDFNKASIKPDSDALLNKVGTLLKATPTLKVELEGHTDNVGGDDYNLKLSDARAASVRNWLVQYGIDASRMTSKGYGKTRPVADNGTDAGRAKNRRVELSKQGCQR